MIVSNMFIYKFKNIIKFKEPKGFTLAELAIAITTIGIILAIILPTAINNAQQSQYYTQTTNAYLYLSNALAEIPIQNKGIIHVGNGNTMDNNNAFRNDLCNVLRCIKMDNSVNIAGNINYMNYKSGSVGYFSTGWDYNPGAVLENGAYLVSVNSYNGCNSGALGNACGTFYIDTNGGGQGPNMFGDDFHGFNVVKNSNGAYSLMPWGMPGDGATACTAGAIAWEGSQGCAYQRIFFPNNMP